MSSSDSDEQPKTNGDTQYMIKPAKGGPSLDTSSWPLLLKVSFGNISQSEAYNNHKSINVYISNFHEKLKRDILICVHLITSFI